MGVLNINRLQCGTTHPFCVFCGSFGHFPVFVCVCIIYIYNHIVQAQIHRCFTIFRTKTLIQGVGLHLYNNSYRFVRCNVWVCVFFYKKYSNVCVVWTCVCVCECFFACCCVTRNLMYYTDTARTNINGNHGGQVNNTRMVHGARVCVCVYCSYIYTITLKQLYN